MNVRTCAAALLLVVGLPAAVLAADFPEIEPNETKDLALANGAFVLADGDSVSGATTGTSTTTQGTGSADTFLIKTTSAARAIYRHRMTLGTAGSPGHVGTLRGLGSSGAGPTFGGDLAFQTSSATTNPARMNQWYGFGNEEQVFYRVTGTTSTTQPYVSTYSVEVVTPTLIDGPVLPGSVSIAPGTTLQTAFDTELFLFDSNFTPIAGIDDADATPINVTLNPGTYYVAASVHNLAAGNASGSSIIQGTYQTGNVLDFTDIAACSSTSGSGSTAWDLNLTHTGGSASSTGVSTGAYEIAWFTFTVAEPSNPIGSGAANPGTVPGDGTGVTAVSVTVTPATNPASSNITVQLDASSVGGGTVNLLDNGIAPDQFAGDNVFTANVTVANGTGVGAYTMPFTVSDAQSRSSSGNVELNVAASTCPAGLANLAFFAVAGDNNAGGAGNSVVTGDFGVAGQINGLVLSGAYTSFTTSWRSETRIRATAPSGTVYDIPVGVGQPTSAGLAELFDYSFFFGGLEDGTGTWTFEFFESFADAVSPDAVWDNICFAARFDATNPSGTGVADPVVVINDGTGSTNLFVTVNPGASPTSTGLVVTVDASPIGLSTITLVDNGVAPDLAAGDNIFSAQVDIPSGTTAGAATLPFTITDDQSRSGGGNIALTVVTPPPACPAGQATLTFNNVASNGAVGDAGNSVVTGSFGATGLANTINISGRLVSGTAYPYNTEARIRITAPSGNIYLVQPFTNGLGLTPRDLEGFTLTIPNVEDAAGTWTFEFYESYNDDASPDNIWQQICFGIDLSPTNPVATDVATPGTVARDGVQEVTLAVTVTPGQVPTSTNLTVLVDDSAVGGTGSLSLADDGVFPDAAAGDNVFTGVTTVSYNTPLGGAALAYTVGDAQGRTFGGTLNFTVVEATGACCTGAGCLVTTIGDCIDVQGGSFAGSGTSCVLPSPMTTDGAGAFEDISATGTVAGVTGGDDAVALVDLPFTFNYFGVDYTSGHVSTNGNFQFGANNSTAFTNVTIPNAAVPNNALFALWDDMDLDVTGEVYYEVRGTPGVDHRFIIQWNNVGQYNVGNTPVDASTFQIVLFEDHSFEFRYLNVSAETAIADTTTIGFEDLTGTNGVSIGETRDSLSATAPVSFRGNSQGQDTGVCGSGSECAACPADYDQDGGVTGGDISAFFADFEQGLPCSDVDQDGGITGADIGYFFFLYEQGGC